LILLRGLFQMPFSTMVSYWFERLALEIEMDKVIFLNIGWMSKYSGPGKISGGGKYVKTQGYGHEMLNFKPFDGRMYGTAVVPRHGAIKLERLGALKGEESVDGVIVFWVARSRIVGWYENARVYRLPQPPPKNSGRFYKGKPIRYRVTAAASDCRLLKPDDRHFRVPRAGDRKQAMGRYIWYAEGKSNQAFRAKALKYVRAQGNISAVETAKRTKSARAAHQSDPDKRLRVERSAVELARTHFESLGYRVQSVEQDNLGWDLTAVHEVSQSLLRLEVKGMSGPLINVELTSNEYKMMRKHKRAYRICVGTDCLKKRRRELSVFAYNETSDKWVDGADRTLKISEVQSARLRLG
jgi:hypothetical protein